MQSNRDVAERVQALLTTTIAELDWADGEATSLRLAAQIEQVNRGMKATLRALKEDWERKDYEADVPSDAEASVLKSFGWNDLLDADKLLAEDTVETVGLAVALGRLTRLGFVRRCDGATGGQGFGFYKLTRAGIDALAALDAKAAHTANEAEGDIPPGAFQHYRDVRAF